MGHSYLYCDLLGKKCCFESEIGGVLGLCRALFDRAAISFEPILDGLGVTYWLGETRETLGVPWIALMGYPSLGVLFFLGWSELVECSREEPEWKRLISFVVLLAIGHVLALDLLKNFLGW